MTNKNKPRHWGEIARERALLCEQLGRTRAQLDQVLGINLMQPVDRSVDGTPSEFLSTKINQLNRKIFELGTELRLSVEGKADHILLDAPDRPNEE